MGRGKSGDYYGSSDNFVIIFINDNLSIGYFEISGKVQKSLITVILG